jgi:hypothetical protein
MGINGMTAMSAQTPNVKSCDRLPALSRAIAANSGRMARVWHSVSGTADRGAR